MIWLEIKFANLLGSHLLLFKQRKNNPYLATFRCPICGDSHRNKLKTRGYIFQHSQHLFVYCHNCNYSASFRKFLKHQNPYLYDEFALELFKENSHGKPITEVEEIFAVPVPVKSRTPDSSGLFDLVVPSITSPVLVHYLKQRKVPENKWKHIFYTEDFPLLVKKVFPEKYISEPKHHRLVIPFYDPSGKEVVGICARALPDADPIKHKRYYSISHPGYPKLWKPNDLDINKTVYVTEGVMDAFFLDNACSMLGSNIDTGVLRTMFDDFVIIFDCEPRNRQIIEQMERKVKEGCKIVVWSNRTKGKDLNEMALNNYVPDLKSRTFSGLEAMLNITQFRKV